MNLKAKEILLRAKKDVFGNLSGDNLTPFKGDGLDFEEIAQYSFGDDIRKINWKASAKTSDIKINIFNDERELNIVLAFLVSGTINFGTIKLKQEIVAEILAILSYSAIKHNNKLQTIFFSQEDEQYFPPNKNEGLVYEILEKSLSFDVIKKQVDYKKFCDFINETFREKSLIFIVGDFYGDVDLSQIAYKNEVYALMVRDRFEEYPYISGEYNFIDPSDFSNIDINMSKSVANEYKKLLDLQDKKTKEHFIQNRIKFAKIYTDDDVFIKLKEKIK